MYSKTPFFVGLHQTHIRPVKMKLIDINLNNTAVVLVSQKKCFDF